MIKNKIKYTLGFTLVELIIVITILAIISTISFISLSGNIKNSRDSSRLTTIQNIKNGLETYLTTKSKLPEPENYINISYSGSSMAHQGYLGDSISSLIGFSKTPSDPLDNSKFTYSVSSDYKKYQVLTMLELSPTAYNFVPKTFAIDYSTRVPKTLGNGIGILLGTGANLNQPIQENYNASTFTGVDIATNTGYLAIINDSKTLSGTDLIILKNTLESGYDKSIKGYYDMETFYSSGGTDYLKDLSGNGNDCTGSGNISVSGIKGLATNTQVASGVRCNWYININSFGMSWYYKVNSFVYSPSISQTGAGIFSINDGNGFSSGAISMYILGNKLYLDNILSGTYSSQVIDYNINIGEWNNLSLNYDGSNYFIYNNGILIKSLQSNQNILINYPVINLSRGIQINSLESSYVIKTNISDDEFKIYNRTLTNSEIKSLYNKIK